MKLLNVVHCCMALPRTAAGPSGTQEVSVKGEAGESQPGSPTSMLTCSQMAPVMVTGKGLTFPRPKFSRFLWLLKSFSSRFSSSSRELQYRTCRDTEVAWKRHSSLVPLGFQSSGLSFLSKRAPVWC